MVLFWMTGGSHLHSMTCYGKCPEKFHHLVDIPWKIEWENMHATWEIKWEMLRHFNIFTNFIDLPLDEQYDYPPFFTDDLLSVGRNQSASNGIQSSLYMFVLP